MAAGCRKLHYVKTADKCTDGQKHRISMTMTIIQGEFSRDKTQLSEFLAAHF